MATRQVGHAALSLMNIVRMKGVPILRQLEMGISGKPAKLVEISPVLEDRIPVIRRFTGGGTVIVDHGTIFVTFICNQTDVPKVQPYPRPIMSWSSLLYSKVFEEIADFKLRENDSSCTFDVHTAIPYLKKTYGDSMHKVLHVGPDTCSIVSQRIKEDHLFTDFMQLLTPPQMSCNL